MRKLIYAFIFSLVVMTSLSAQIDSTQFLFGKFEEGQIFFKDGRVYNAQVNYNLIVNCFLFIDTNDNNEMRRFADVDKIACIKVGDRSFLQQSNGNVHEVISPEPFIAVKYKGKIRAEGKQVGYGGRSETASVESYSSMFNSGYQVNLETEKLLIAGIDKQYLIEVNGKRKTFETPKQFLKIYSKHKDVLEKYIEDNDVKFNQIDQAVKLISYANALK